MRIAAAVLLLCLVGCDEPPAPPTTPAPPAARAAAKPADCGPAASGPCATTPCATGLADLCGPAARPTPVRDFLKGLFVGRLCADPCAPAVCADPCATAAAPCSK